MTNSSPARRWSPGTAARCIGPPLLLTLVSCVNVTVTLTTSSATFPADGPFGVTVVATNTGEGTVIWGQGSSSCQLAAVIRVDGRDYGFGSRACTADYGRQGLTAGSTRTEGFLWEGEVRIGETTMVLPPGRYEFRGLAGDVAMSPPVTVEVTQEVPAGGAGGSVIAAGGDAASTAGEGIGCGSVARAGDLMCEVLAGASGEGDLAGH